MNSFDLFFSNPHFKIRLSSFVTIVLCGNLFEHLTELTNKFNYSLNQSTQKSIVKLVGLKIVNEQTPLFVHLIIIFNMLVSGL